MYVHMLHFKQCSKKGFVTCSLVISMHAINGGSCAVGFWELTQKTLYVFDFSLNITWLGEEEHALLDLRSEHAS